jgi:hypothetical protein
MKASTSLESQVRAPSLFTHERCSRVKLVRVILKEYFFHYEKNKWSNNKLEFKHLYYNPMRDELFIVNDCNYVVYVRHLRDNSFASQRDNNVAVWLVYKYDGNRKLNALCNIKDSDMLLLCLKCYSAVLPFNTLFLIVLICRNCDDKHSDQKDEYNKEYVNQENEWRVTDIDNLQMQF